VPREERGSAVAVQGEAGNATGSFCSRGERTGGGGRGRGAGPREEERRNERKERKRERKKGKREK
jgi:hypothetical protein